jgi:sugar diacid utilization regulator
MMASAVGRATASASPPARLGTVQRVTDERAHLYRLIQTIGAGPDLDAILRGVVGLVTEATACHACFVYFAHVDHLELRAASPMYEHLEGEVRIPFGEGLTGWVASTRRSAYVRERALDDPRVRRAYFPELGDEVYQSLVSAPIFGRAGDVIGVITLHAEAPFEFGRSDLDFLEHTAALIGGAVENARLYEDATAKVSLLSDLSQLSQRIASASDQEDLIRLVVEGVRDLLDATRVEIHLEDEGAGGATERHDAESLAAISGEEPVDVSYVAPLVVGDERLGVLGVVLPSARTDAQAALASVAAHTAVALKQHQVIERLREKNLVKDFFQLLARDDAPIEELSSLAGSLGWVLDAPHLVLQIVPWNGPVVPSGKRRSTADRREPRWPDLAGQAEGRLAAGFPGLLVDTLERSLWALLPLGDLATEDAIASMRQMNWGDTASSAAVSVGVSNPCERARAFARGFREASSAAEVGALIRGKPGVTAYEDLGPYKYVLRQEDAARDRTQQQLQLLVHYDDRRGTQLLDTLEGYLDHRGNVVATSRALFIHPNTLRQRLDRIRRVSGIDLDREDWLSLAVATKVVKLRRMRRATEREGGNDG